ncbi:MAG: radical SAM protein [Chloroflexi bacterium]|nr:radical SAM protein [Chloroflexota bacterium]
MNPKTLWAEVDERGRLVLPAELTAQFDLKPGARLRLDQELNGMRVHRPLTQLNKLYIEPTDLCNIECRTCMRNTWNEPMGRMRRETFEHIVQAVAALEHKPAVMFAGIGEPTFHAHIVEMIQRVQALGCFVEITTNGTTLTAPRARQFIDAGLDVLWVSLDGATPESYADVRLGAELPQVLANLERFNSMRKGGHFARPEIGIAFVALKHNIAELPEVIALGKRLGATRFSVSNVLPYSHDMRAEILYGRALKDIAYLSSQWLPRLSLPKMDLQGDARAAFLAALESGCSVNFAGNRLSGANDSCTFIESGALAVGWDGNVSPCPPLLHNQITYLKHRERRLRKHSFGNVNARPLLDIWNDSAYLAYRERVMGFAFAPCTFCGGCELLDTNETDCLGNPFPVCGGCLWAQGLIQCP